MPKTTKIAKWLLALNNLIAPSTALFCVAVIFSTGCVSNQSFQSQIISESHFKESVDAFIEDWSSNDRYDPEALKRLTVTVLHRGLTVPSRQLNVQAIKAVERFEVESLAQHVMNLVDHQSDVVSATAAVAVIKSHPPAPHVAKRLVSSSDAEARKIIAEGLGRKIGILASEDLVLLANDPAPKVQKAALGALAKTKSADFRELYIQKLKSSDSGVVQVALKGLASHPNSTDLNLIKFAYTHPHLGVRLASLRVLESIGKKSKKVLEYLADPKRQDQRMALETATLLEKKYGFQSPFLLKSLLLGNDTPSRSLALRKIHLHLEESEWKAILERELKSNSAKERWLAARLLNQRGALTSFETTSQDLFASAPKHLKIEIAGELAQRGDKDALLFLSNELTHASDSELPALLQALRQAGKPTPGLVQLLKSNSTQTRLDAAEVLLSSKI